MVTSHWHRWGPVRVVLSSGVVTLSRFKIEFWIDGRPLASTESARNPAPLVSESVADHLLALAAPDKRLILAPSSDEVSTARALSANAHLTSQQSLYLDYVLPNRDLDHAWVTWRVGQSSGGELLLRLTDGDAREVVRRYFGSAGFVGFVLNSSAAISLRDLAVRINSAFVVGTPTYYLEGLTPGGLVVEEADDGCALSIYTADITEEELRSRLPGLQ